MYLLQFSSNMSQIAATYYKSLQSVCIMAWTVEKIKE